MDIFKFEKFKNGLTDFDSPSFSLVLVQWMALRHFVSLISSGTFLI